VDTLEIEATVTKRGQTTLPSAIRKVLKVTAADDRIVYRVLMDGSVTLAKKEGPGDPMIAAFLEFIANDTRNNFGSLRPVTPEWLAGVQKLVAGVEVDLEASLSDDDE
jgi:antitoxin PrlF